MNLRPKRKRTGVIRVGSSAVLGHTITSIIIPSADSVVVETKDWDVELDRSEVQSLLAAMNAVKAYQSLGLKSQPADLGTSRNQSPPESSVVNEQPQQKKGLKNLS